MNLLFCGTPDFARTILARIHTEFPDAALSVVSAPARRQGRGMTLIHPPVAAYALEKGLPLYQPETLKSDAFLPHLEEIRPDLAIVAAYGKILPAYFLNFPLHGCMNVHASLLPEYRGASPIQRAIWDGKSETGVTIMQMDEGLDTGDMLFKRALPITGTDNTDTLTARLASLGAEMICEAIRAAFEGTLEPKAQDDARSTYAAKLDRSDESLDFSLSAARLSCQIRALAPRPCANARLPDGSELKLCSVAPTDRPAAEPGRIRLEKRRVFFSCGDYELELLRAKPQGKGETDAASLVNGRKLKEGDLLR